MTHQENESLFTLGKTQAIKCSGFSSEKEFKKKQGKTEKLYLSLSSLLPYPERITDTNKGTGNTATGKAAPLGAFRRQH